MVWVGPSSAGDVPYSGCRRLSTYQNFRLKDSFCSENFYPE